MFPLYSKNITLYKLQYRHKENRLQLYKYDSLLLGQQLFKRGDSCNGVAVLL